MKKRYALLLAMATVCLFSSCAGRRLKLSYYRKNIIIEQDGRIRVGREEGYIDFGNLRQELVNRLITEKSPVTVHVHRELPREDFDKIYRKLRSEGFSDLSFRTYRIQ